MPGIWIFGENQEQTLELLSIGGQIAAKTGTGISVFTNQPQDKAKEYAGFGADEILLLAPLASGQSLDAYIPVIAAEAKAMDPDLILISATAKGKDLAARLAAQLDAGLCSSCLAVNYDGGAKQIVMNRLAYGGAGVQKITCVTRPAMATIPPKTFEAATPGKTGKGNIRELPAPAPSAVKIIEKKTKEREARDITEARIIACVGRGVDKKEDISLVQQLADALEGDIGCTRPISEELHWLSEDYCIGISASQVKPDLYVGVGVSGQVQHVTGIRSARVIAAINKDENAPIFDVADFGIVGDLYDVVPKLIAELKK